MWIFISSISLYLVVLITYLLYDDYYYDYFNELYDKTSHTHLELLKSSWLPFKRHFYRNYLLTRSRNSEKVTIPIVFWPITLVVIIIRIIFFIIPSIFIRWIHGVHSKKDDILLSRLKGSNISQMNDDDKRNYIKQLEKEIKLEIKYGKFEDD
jgi:hypothetical protein